MSSESLEVVNISGGGEFDREIDVEEVAANSTLPVAYYNPNHGAGYFRLNTDEELLILFRSGKFIFRGGDNFEDMYSAYDQFLSHFTEIEVNHNNPELAVNNVVAVGKLDRYLDLNAFSIGLGFENIEYEPEQFPGLIYRPEGSNCVLLIFTSGKVVITGGKSLDENVDAFNQLQNSAENIFS